MSYEPVTSEAQIAQVAALAHEIWNEYYVPIIGQAQVDYMVERFQSATAIGQQIGEGYEYFLIRTSESEPAVGYLALRTDADALFLSKLYVTRKVRGTGLGAQALQFVESVAARNGSSRVWLTVNKGNPAQYVYERKGFVRAEAIVMDIGGGFVMDDYRMEKFLA